MRTFKQPIVVVLAATLAATVGGASAGFLLARAVVMRIAEGRLVDQAARSLAVADAYAADARKALALMNASPYSNCSDGELTYFRHILFNSRYLREGGRMADARIECSTTLGRNELPQDHFEPIYSGQDGVRWYWDPAPFHIGSQATSILQMGTSYVVVAMDVSGEDLPPGASLAVTPRKVYGQPANPAMAGNSTALTEDGYRRVDQTLSATHCSTQNPDCVTVAISLQDVFHMGRPMFAVCMVLLGLAGAVLGIFRALAYLSNQALEHQLRRAIRRDKIRMVYQPIVDLASRRVVGAEALARWTNEDGLEVGPDVFIPLAEAGNFVGEITRLALRHVLRDLGAALRADPGFYVSLNVTAWDLAKPGFVPMLKAALAQAGIRPESLTIEITEDSTVRIESAIETIRQLRAIGHQVHIDDFGTGYSSLAYLQDLSVDAIKIDKVFTQAIGTDSMAVGVLPQILAMADALHLEIVVEGIETEEQAQYFASPVKRIRAQGWLFGQPARANVFLEVLAKGREKDPASGR